MRNLPLIVGFGGISPAGRSSGNLAYQRLVFDALSTEKQQATLHSLSLLMGIRKFRDGGLVDQFGNAVVNQALDSASSEYVLNNTLLRKISKSTFDSSSVLVNKKASLQGQSTNSSLSFTLKSADLPVHPPENWVITQLNNGLVNVSCSELDVLIPGHKNLKVSSAGQLPEGLDIASLYSSRHHPKGLEMTVFGASDALNSTGIDIELIKSLLAPEQIGVYASSSMGQLDDKGIAGFTQSALQGKRTSSKQMPFAFPEMPADFINAYMIGNLGYSSGSVGACATFLYNLERAVSDIQSGKRHVAIVGVSEAPITPEVLEAYRTMGALAEDDALMKLDAHLGLTEPRHRLACRPFGNNCGFTMGESSQFAVLFSAEFALKTGANVLAAVPGVSIHADAYKKSIASPGIGNYLSLGKSVSLAEKILGQKSVQTKSYVHAHGTGTPQNRTTESHVLNEIAKVKGINNWPVSSVKCYLGHSLGAAGGDQLMAALGTWNEGLIPGIFSVDEFADDIHDSNLHFSQNHIDIGKDGADAAFLNSKGFGGNNATACVLSPSFAGSTLKGIASSKDYKQYSEKHNLVKENIEAYSQSLQKGENSLIYHFGDNVASGDDLTFSEQGIKVPGYANEVSLDIENPYELSD